MLKKTIEWSHRGLRLWSLHTISTALEVSTAFYSADHEFWAAFNNLYCLSLRVVHHVYIHGSKSQFPIHWSDPRHHHGCGKRDAVMHPRWDAGGRMQVAAAGGDRDGESSHHWGSARQKRHHSFINPGQRRHQWQLRQPVDRKGVETPSEMKDYFENKSNQGNKQDAYKGRGEKEEHSNLQAPGKWFIQNTYKSVP